MLPVLPDLTSLHKESILFPQSIIWGEQVCWCSWKTGAKVKVESESQHLCLGLCSGFHRHSLKTLPENLEVVFLTSCVKDLLATAIQKVTGSTVLIILFKSLMNVG